MSTVAVKFWCDLLGIPVYEAAYFKGTVVHEPIHSPWRAALVTFAPLTINTVLCAILLFPIAFSILTGTQKALVFDGILAWAGVSIGAHALPSKAKIESYLDRLPDDVRRGPFFGLLCAAGLVFVVIDFLKRVWFDFIYAGLVGAAAPIAITRLYMAF